MPFLAYCRTINHQPETAMPTYRTVPRLDATKTYDIMGRRCRWVGSASTGKEQVHEFRVEGDLDSRTYSDRQVVELIDAGAFRVVQA